MNMKLSPDGQYLAFRSTKDGVRSAVVVEIDTGEMRRAYGTASTDVHQLLWGGDDRIMFSMIKDNSYGYGLVSMPRENLRSKRLNNFDVLRVVNPLEHNEKYAIVSILATNELSVGLHRMNLKTGISRTLERDSDYPDYRRLDYSTNRDGDVLTMYGYKDQKMQRFYRPEVDAEWIPFAVEDTTSLDKITYMALDRNELIYWVTGYEKDDTTPALYTYDLQSNELSERIYTDKDYDISEGSLFRDRKSQRVVGISYDRRGPETIWFDEEYSALQATIDSALPDTVNRIVSTDNKINRVVVYAYTDQIPGTFYVFDMKKKGLVFKLDTRSWLNPKDLHRQFMTKFTMDDGLKIHGYVTLPGPQSEKPFPTVVLVHGGPWVRDTWGFDPEVQFLAQRGFAVLQVNYRGSSGYSDEVSWDSRGDFERMVRDVCDATRAMVKTGLADPSRIGIMGGSFGGYAALAAPMYEPDLFACAVSFAGVFDMEQQLENWRSGYWQKRQGSYAYDRWTEALGEEGSTPERLRAISPMRHADKIKIPVYLSHGRRDKVVEDEQTVKMAEALRDVGNPPVVRFLNQEGHGLNDEDSRKQEYRAVESFLVKHLSPAQVTVSAR